MKTGLPFPPGRGFVWLTALAKKPEETISRCLGFRMLLNPHLLLPGSSDSSASPHSHLHPGECLPKAPLSFSVIPEMGWEAR